MPRLSLVICAACSLYAIGALVAAPANAAAVLTICDAPGCGSPDPNITFTSSGFQPGLGNFKVNGTPTNGVPFVISENGTDISGSAEISFEGRWMLPMGANVTPANETIFFTEGTTADISDVLHFTFSQSGRIGHLDGSVISDNNAFPPITVAELNAMGIFATQTLPETGAPFAFNNTAFTGTFISDVPEPSTWAALLVGLFIMGPILWVMRRSSRMTA